MTSSPSPHRHPPRPPRIASGARGCHAGEALVLPSSTGSRARCPPRVISDQITSRQVKLTLGSSAHYPRDPGRAAAVPCWRWSPSSRPTTGGRTRACPRGGQRAPARQAVQAQPDAGGSLVKLYRSGEHTISALEELLAVRRSAMSRAVRCADAAEWQQPATASERRTAFRACSGGCAASSARKSIQGRLPHRLAIVLASPRRCIRSLPPVESRWPGDTDPSALARAETNAGLIRARARGPTLRHRRVRRWCGEVDVDGLAWHFPHVHAGQVRATRSFAALMW